MIGSLGTSVESSRATPIPSRKAAAATFCGSFFAAAAARRTYSSVSSIAAEADGAADAAFLGQEPIVGSRRRLPPAPPLWPRPARLRRRSDGSSGTPSRHVQHGQVLRRRRIAGQRGGKRAVQRPEPLLGLRRKLGRDGQADVCAVRRATTPKHFSIDGVETDLKARARDCRSEMSGASPISSRPNGRPRGNAPTREPSISSRSGSLTCRPHSRIRT